MCRLTWKHSMLESYCSQQAWRQILTENALVWIRAWPKGHASHQNLRLKCSRKPVRIQPISDRCCKKRTLGVMRICETSVDSGNHIRFRNSSYHSCFFSKSHWRHQSESNNDLLNRTIEMDSWPCEVLICTTWLMAKEKTNQGSVPCRELTMMYAFLNT